METPEHQIDRLIIKLRNLQILLEEAVLRGLHLKARDLIGEISQITNQIEDIRNMNDNDIHAQTG